VLLVLPAGAAA